jgi:quercetin dioxygenase-like cupin family protein
MSSINRPLAGPLLTFDLGEHFGELRNEESYVRTGRAGRTLAKSGRMRLVAVAMDAGNEIHTHQAESPMTIQVLSGRIRYRAAGDVRELGTGQVLFFGPGDANDIRAEEPSALLLTISAIRDDFEPEAKD